MSKAAGDRKKEGTAFSNLGTIHHAQKKLEKAAEYQEISLAIFEEIGDKDGVTLSCNNLGGIYCDLGQHQKSILYHQRALELCKDISASKGQLQCYKNLGTAYNLTGEGEKAIGYYTKGLELSNKMGDKKEQMTLYQKLYTLSDALGRKNEADKYQQKAEQIKEEFGERPEESESEEIIAQCVYYVFDLYEKSIENQEKCGMITAHKYEDHSPEIETKASIRQHEREMEIGIATGDKLGEESAYNSLAGTYLNLGQYVKSIVYFEKALKLSKATGRRGAEAKIYNGLGVVYQTLCQHERAKTYHEEALKIQNEIQDKSGEDSSYTNLAGIYRDLGQYKEATDYQKQSLSICIQSHDREGEALSYNNLGSIANARGQHDVSLAYHKKALKIRTEIKDKKGEGITYVNLGNVYFALGQYEESIRYLEMGLQIIKETGLKDKEHLILYSLGVSHFHQDSFTKASDYFFESIKGHESIREFLKDEYKLSLDEQRISFYKGLPLLLLNLGKKGDALCAAEKGRARALVDLMSVNFGIQEVENTSEFTLSSISRLVESQQVNFLFMSVITRHVYLWVIDKDGKISVNASMKEPELDTSSLDDLVPIPLKGGVVDAPALKDLVLKTLIFLPADDKEEYEDRSFAAFYEEESSTTEEEQSDEGDQYYLRGNGEEERDIKLMKLYDQLIGPILKFINGPEIVIIPEGNMFTIPFAALKDSDGKCLSETKRIRLIPSLTSLLVIQDSPKEYHAQTGTLIVADPVVQGVEFEGKVGNLKPLPNARTEADMISRYVTAPILKLIGEQATKEEVLKRIQDVSLVHIAAHGDAERGEIALTPNKRTDGIARMEDYLLRMEDIAKVGIRAKLVVLSCCNTGRGKVLTAEGVVGISRAFLGSGARSVLMTLWPVDDAATKTFMNVFYRSLMRHNKSASEALHLSAEKLRKSSLYNHFRHWAAFALLGDDVKFD